MLYLEHSAGTGNMHTRCINSRQGWHMNSAMLTRRLCGLFLVLGLLTGCASEFVTFHSMSGNPTLIARRGYTPDGCTEKIKEDAIRMGVTLRYIHVRGNFPGRSLLWPFEPGYACEAGIGTEQPPVGTYPMQKELISKGS